MLLFFDTETTGLPDFNLRASDPSQPHIVQLAALLTDDDGEVLESHNVIVKPDGWMIPKEAVAIHGITNEVAIKVGLPERLVASLLLEMIKKATLNIGHHLKFDKFVARIAMRRFGLLTDEAGIWWTAMPGFCTMLEMTAVCQLPGKYPGNYKWPKLCEAYFHAFRKPLSNAHDALADVVACKDLYFWLKDLEKFPQPVGGGK